MNRRNALLALTGAVTTSLLARQALAQPATTSTTMPQLSASEYRDRTLLVGSLALQSSELATQRAIEPRVRQFAQFEVAEQISMAQVLTRTSEANPTPMPLDATHAAMLQSLAGLQGRPFDVAYVQAQIRGHQELLAIQQGFLQAPVTDSDREHIAVLARTMITMHLTMLQDLAVVMRA